MMSVVGLEPQDFIAQSRPDIELLKRVLDVGLNADDLLNVVLDV